MRNGAHWSNSGGSTICGKRGDSVCDRSTTRTLVARKRAGKLVNSLRAHWSPQLAFEHLLALAEARQDVLRDIAGIDVLDAVAQRRDDRFRQRCRRELRRRHELVPFVVDRAGKHVHHADARSRACRRAGSATAQRPPPSKPRTCLRRQRRQRIDRQQVDPRGRSPVLPSARAGAHRRAERLRQTQQPEIIHLHFGARGFGAAIRDAVSAVDSRQC